MRILFIGDINGKAGRKGVQKLLPKLREEIQPDVVIANAENIAHGTGITRSTFEEIRAAGVDACTSGNHAFTKPEGIELLNDPSMPLIRPANFPPDTPGTGIREILVEGKKLLLINLQGRVFMNQDLDDPFRMLDSLLEASAQPDAILVDFHAEATSEKVAFGHWADGKVSAIIGTHTHIGTADARILPGGSAYITDVGMVGARESVLGVDKDVIIKQFLTQLKAHHVIPETGPVTFNAVLIDTESPTRSRSIERVDRETEV